MSIFVQWITHSFFIYVIINCFLCVNFARKKATKLKLLFFKYIFEYKKMSKRVSVPAPLHYSAKIYHHFCMIYILPHQTIENSVNSVNKNATLYITLEHTTMQKKKVSQLCDHTTTLTQPEYSAVRSYWTEWNENNM